MGHAARHGDSSAPSGRRMLKRERSTGCATPKAASLHPWLHSVAPSGPKSLSRQQPTAAPSALSCRPGRGTLYPREKTPDRSASALREGGMVTRFCVTMSQ